MFEKKKEIYTVVNLWQKLGSDEKIQITEKPEYSGPVMNETNKLLSSCFNKWIHQSVGYSTNFTEQRLCIRKY